MSPYLHDRTAASGGRFAVGRHIVSRRFSVSDDEIVNGRLGVSDRQ
jgi:hypothetical protein